MKTGDRVFVSPKTILGEGDWASVQLASENNNSLWLVLAEGNSLVLLRDGDTHPFWRDTNEEH